MIHVIGFTKDKTIEKQDYFTEADWDQFAWMWIDLETPTPEELAQITEYFQLHPASIEYKQDKARRPKIEAYDDYMFCITHLLQEKNNEIVKQELDFFIDSKFILTIHHSPIEEVRALQNTFQSSDKYGYWPTYEVFRYLLDAIVESYLTLIDKIEEDLEDIEDNTQNKKMDDLMMDLFDIRKMLLHIATQCRR